jgi:8-oxo-dGTP pyrophosphatase MutT (NUDIX family)
MPSLAEAEDMPLSADAEFLDFRIACPELGSRSASCSQVLQFKHSYYPAGMAKHKDTLQFAALPWRLDDRGMRQIMLLTSRETQRWVIPKGWPMKGKKLAEVAAQEAFEEAGLLGKIIGKKPLGIFHYPKRLTHRIALCEVRVYLFRVEGQHEMWPEMKQRETRWFDANEAAELVDESGLAAIIERFAGSQVRFFAFRRAKRRAHLLRPDRF